jgi:hypothetical protein
VCKSGALLTADPSRAALLEVCGKAYGCSSACGTSGVLEDFADGATLGGGLGNTGFSNFNRKTPGSELPGVSFTTT